ncbi:MAG TPA: hypothetical protein VIE64_02350 [Solirubrobacterales bacterium]
MRGRRPIVNSAYTIGKRAQHGAAGKLNLSPVAEAINSATLYLANRG